MRGNYISGEARARKNWARLASEMGKEPEKEGQQQTEDEAGDDREIESGVFPTVNDVTRKFSEAEGEFAAEVEQRAKDGEQSAEK